MDQHRPEAPRAPADVAPWAPENGTTGSPLNATPTSPSTSTLPPSPDLSPDSIPTFRPTPAGPRERGVFRVAFLAALLSSILTVSGSFLVFRAVWPEAAAPAPSASPVSASASPVPSASPTAAASPSIVATAPDAASATVTATAKILPSVVTINTETAARRGTVSGVGSGFVFDARGWILTNRHVVSGVGTISVTLADGRVLPGQAYGISSSNDLAIVKIEALDLPAATIGDSRGLLLGQGVVVVGSPLGDYPGSVSTGIVSGLGRAIDITGVERLTNLIQTDAAVNPGNSGGPVVDLAGRVIGVATATSAAQGISFAIPIEDARSVMVLALAGQPIP